MVVVSVTDRMVVVVVMGGAEAGAGRRGIV
jgi:hypothetical protein